MIRLFYLLQTSLFSQVLPPKGWGDFKMGLVNDGSEIFNTRMKNAINQGCKLDYRYAYLHNGPDPKTNSMSYLFGYGNDYIKDAPIKVGSDVKSALVIYMLQEDATFATFQKNINSVTFMKNFFTTVKTACQKANGSKSIFVIEPDTWGYILEAGKDPTLLTAKVNNLGAGYEFLAGIPNTASGVCQAIVKTIRLYAPDAYCGILLSHWGYWAGEVTTASPRATEGMVWWTNAQIDVAVQKNIEFYNKLFINSTDKGDFVGVEKYGYSAGAVKKLENSTRFYWGDTENAKYLRWCKGISDGLKKPILGWQISIGHTGLKNSCKTVGTDCSFEDTFFPYFFTHVNDFINAGFIGFLAGKGMDDDTDYSNFSEGASVGDGGWFFSKLQNFDLKRPYINKLTESEESVLNNTRIIQDGDKLRIESNASINQVSLFDMQGNVLRNYDNVEDNTLEINDLKSGMFIIKTNKWSKKLIIQ